MRRTVAGAAVLALALLVTVAPSVNAAGRFTDDNGNVHEPMIEAVAAEGVTGGCGPALYCPTSPVSRGQMASFLSRALQLGPATADHFADDAGSPHEDAINRVASAGIATGRADGTFGPSENVERRQMASFIARGFNVGPTDRDYFADDNGDVHEDNINRLARAEITGGCGGLNYCPLSSVLRDQMASFLGRALGLAPLTPGTTIYEGSGDQVPAIVKPTAGEPALATITHTGSSNFAVWEFNAAGEQGNLLVNEIGNYSGTVLIDAPLFDDGDTTRLEIEADGNWRVVVRPLSDARRFGGPISGAGDDVLVYTGMAQFARLTHNGSSNFAIWSYGADDADLVVNEIGNYDGVKSFPRGERIIEITADGSWTIAPQ